MVAVLKAHGCQIVDIRLSPKLRRKGDDGLAENIPFHLIRIMPA